MPLKLYKRGKTWHYRGTVAKRLLRGSTKTQSKEIAQRIASNLEGRTWQGHFDPASVLTFAQAAILYRQAGKSPRFLGAIEDYWKETPVSEITAGAIRDSAITLYPHVRPSTRNRQVIVPTQAVINHAAESELCPAIKVKRFQSSQKRAKIPATAEWVQAAMRATAHKPRLSAVVCFMYATGARVSQAIRLDWTEVDFRYRKVLVRATRKGDDDRWAHMPPELIAALANIQGERTGRVFGFNSRQNLSTQLEAAVVGAGLKNLTPHCMRHGFATVLLDKGTNPKTVADRGGWKDVKTMLENYAHDIAPTDATDTLFDTETTQPAGKRSAIK